MEGVPRYNSKSVYILYIQQYYKIYIAVYTVVLILHNIILYCSVNYTAVLNNTKN